MANPYQYTGKGEGFLTDYSGLAAAGSGLQSFADAYMKAKHQQAQDLEMDAKMKALQGQESRAANEQAIKMHKERLTQNPDGSLGYRPMDQTELLEHNTKLFNEGGMQDPEDPSKVIINPDTPKMKDIEAKGAMRGALNDQRSDRLAFAKHKAAVGAVGDDKETKALLGGYQSINNALVNFKASGGMPQEFHQLQTALRMNAGSGNRTGVEERSKGYADDYGIKASEAMQIITGNISDIELRSPKMVKAIMGIADAELKNKQDQASQQIAKRAGMYGGVYKNQYGAQYEDAFKDTVRKQYGQFGLDENGTRAGLVNSGLTGGSLGAQAAPKMQQMSLPIDPKKMSREEKLKFLQGGGSVAGQ